MLIEFKVTNFRSIKETQTLSMVAGNATKDRELAGNAFDSGIPKLGSLLKSAVVYGPNAAGKSNLIAALAFMEHMVRTSATEAQVGKRIKVNPFRLEAASRNEDTEFEIHFIAEKVRYQYGFTLNTQRITSEWLLAYPYGSPQRWFHRQYNRVTEKYDYEFKPSFTEGKARIERSNYTIANNLYLSVAVQKNSQQLLPVFNWFLDKLNYLTSMSDVDSSHTLGAISSPQDKQQVLAFMNDAGIGIKDFLVEKNLRSSEDFPENFPKELVQKFIEDHPIIDTKFLYESNDDKSLIAFDLDDESEGTQALFGFAPWWIDLLKNDEILFVDEIDTHLHPLLVHHLVKMLHLSKSKAQLVFTTHDTTLLSQRIMRRDQVWFVEKDKHQSTKLYSLADFSPRPNEAIEARYLNGRYGAIPFLSELDFYGE